MSYVRVTIKPGVGVVVLVCCALSGAAWLGVQWWSWQFPADFEQCAAQADRIASSKGERLTLIAQCDKQFVGRRKPGGGYTYFDFLQNRHFDIAGPNPTPDELKYFDQEYALYLDTQRKDAAAAATAEKRNQQAQAELENDRLAALIVPPGSHAVAPTSVPIPKARSRTVCEDASLSCSWSRFTAGIKNFFESKAKLSRP
jgi:hypothetical protein